ncbi:hypothetical protein AVEN_115965-1 [Araneus ventricosus]|uniref:Uncharacterized protein n=1 Tax=Araneus ventricosus TaxID=182803 RepID=A0A4Y2XB13_ARAVE|nr:hypothetical protein AVEN_195261-1 [Araneus ventricosus]GBO46407.1 hypothetical protein AVEN_115965-1 [Araneus ventricosus]
MQLRKLFGGQFLVVLFHNLIDIIAIHLQSPYLGQRHNLIDYRLRRKCHKPLKVTFDKVLRPKLLPRRSEKSFGNPLPRIFDHLEAGNDVEVISGESRGGTIGLQPNQN